MLAKSVGRRADDDMESTSSISRLVCHPKVQASWQAGGQVVRHVSLQLVWLSLAADSEPNKLQSLHDANDSNL